MDAHHGRAFERLAQSATAVALALAVASVVAAWSRPAATPVAITTKAAAGPAVPGPQGHHLLDRLRMAAVQGDADASAALAASLLDRFDREGRRDDLHEAVHWIARDWHEPPFLQYDMARRVVDRHCQDAVLRWHWLCISGE